MVAAGDMSQGVVRRLGVGDLAEKLQGVRQPRRGGSRWGATSWLWLVYLSCGDDLTPVASDTHPDFKLQCQRSTFNVQRSHPPGLSARVCTHFRIKHWSGRTVSASKVF
jgi:hypothetical protein